MYKDNLQLDILQARANLPQKTKKAIDAVNWREVIKRMGTKYSPEQLKILEKKTELLLCGLLKTDDYPKELGLEMNISKEKTISLITEMDILVFQKIQKELEKEIDKTDLSITKDPIFSDLPQNIEEAISKSNWKEKTYNIAEKYKLTIEQMGILEDLTIKVMKNEIRPADYKNRLQNKINIPNESLVNLVEDINQGVLKDIIVIIKEQEQEVLKEEEKKKEEVVPVPPYKKDQTPKIWQKKDVEPKENIPLPPKRKGEEPTSENQKSEPVEKIIDKTAIPLPLGLNKGQNKVLDLNTEKEGKKNLPDSINVIKEVTIIEKTDSTPKGNYQIDPYREKI
jgi:hypothetical protein